MTHILITFFPNLLFLRKVSKAETQSLLDSIESVNTDLENSKVDDENAGDQAAAAEMSNGIIANDNSAETSMSPELLGDLEVQMAEC